MDHKTNKIIIQTLFLGFAFIFAWLNCLWRDFIFFYLVPLLIIYIPATAIYFVKGQSKKLDKLFMVVSYLAGAIVLVAFLRGLRMALIIYSIVRAFDYEFVTYFVLPLVSYLFIIYFFYMATRSNRLLINYK